MQEAERLAHFFLAVAIVVVGALLWAASPIVTLVFVAWLICAIAGYVIGEPKGRGAAGIVLPSVTGPFGLVVVAMLAPSPELQAERERNL